MNKSSKSFTDISLDLETFGNGPRSIIASIGAVAFNRVNTATSGCDTFEIFVDFDDQINSREIDGATLMWWLSQSKAAQVALVQGSKNALPLSAAMSLLREFVSKNCNMSNVRVWGNGASFDNAILSDAFKQTKVQMPWQFWNDRCLRTLLGEFYETTGRKLKDEVKFIGTRHSAMSDALHQANLVITATDETAKAKTNANIV